MSRSVIYFNCFSVLSAGAFSALANKGLYDYKSDGLCGTYGFEKPYFLTLCMFIGEALCLIGYYMSCWFSKTRNKMLLSSWFPLFYSYTPPLTLYHSNHGIEPEPQNRSSKHDEKDEEEELEHDDETSLLQPSQRVSVSSSSSDAPPAASIPATLEEIYLSEDELERKRAAAKPTKFVYLGLCLFDLSASAIGGVGLLYIDASSNQMLRGSMVVFTALFSWMILRRRLSTRQWMGIMCVVLGLALVGMCGLFRAHASPSQTAKPSVSPSMALLGLLLVLSGSALNSIQNVFEEMLVKRLGPDSVDSLELVGWEGVFGMLISGLILLPIVHAVPGSNCGSVENTHDTWILMKSSGLITFLIVGYTLCLSLVNASSVILSKEVSAVFRQLINALRVILIWIIAILLFYVWSKGTMGEGWDRFSWFQLSGFIMLIIGTFVYGMQEADVNTHPVSVMSNSQFSDDSHAHAHAHINRGSDKGILNRKDKKSSARSHTPSIQIVSSGDHIKYQGQGERPFFEYTPEVDDNKKSQRDMGKSI